MNHYGSSKEHVSQIRAVVVLLLVLVATCLPDSKNHKSSTYTSTASPITKRFAAKIATPIKPVVHLAKEDSSSGQEDSDSAKEDSSSAKGDSSSAKEDSSSAKGDSSSDKGDSSSAKGDSSSAKDDSSSAKGDSSSAKGDSSSAKGDSSSGKGDSSSAKGDSSSGKGDTSSAKGDSSSTKEESSSSKGDSSSAKGDSGSSKEESGSAKKDSSKEGSSAAAEGPSSAKKDSAAEGPSSSKKESAADGPSSAAEGPSSATKSSSSAAEGPSSAAKSSSSASSGPSTGKKSTLPAGPIELPGAEVFDVTTHGAKGDGQPHKVEGGDGECQNAVAFIQAWHKACESTKASKVLIPKGEYVVGQVLFTGPCKSSPIMVENQGTLLANPDLSLYPSAEWILFEKVENVIFTGSGVVNGQGSKNWPKEGAKGKGNSAPLPTSIKLHRANNSIVDGIKSVDSMFFHMFLAVCSNVTIRGVNLTAPGDSPNTDGIHTSGSNDITIYDSTIGTGDDCISIGQGSTNINAYNVVCGPGHGISVGSLGKEDEEEDVRGIHVWNCTLKGTDNGARIKTWPGKVDTVADEIFYDDIVMDSVKNPIIIDTNYQSKNSNTEPSHVKLLKIHFKNIRGTSSDPNVVTLNCSQAEPCNQVTLESIGLKASAGKGVTSCQNAKVQMVGQNEGIACPS